MNEATSYLMPAGYVCDEHKETLPDQEWIIDHDAQTVRGTASPILVGDSLQALDEHILVDVVRWRRDGTRTFNPPRPPLFSEDRVTLRIRQRGSDEERELTLVIPPEMFEKVSAYFGSFGGREDQPETPS